MSTTIIPAQPGTLATWAGPDGAQHSEPVIAWSVEIEGKNSIHVVPIGPEGWLDDNATVTHPK